MKCKACFERFDDEDTFHEHLADEHGSGPFVAQQICPHSMLHVRDLLVEALIPDWVKNPPEDQADIAAKTRYMLEDWDRAIVHNLLTVLDEAGYAIVKAGR